MPLLRLYTLNNAFFINLISRLSLLSYSFRTLYDKLAIAFGRSVRLRLIFLEVPNLRRSLFSTSNLLFAVEGVVSRGGNIPV